MAFVGIDFKQFIADVKAEGTSQSFKYVSPDNWIDFDLGIFPEALKDNSFTLKVQGISSHEEVDAWSLVDTNIEFVLSSVHDKYLQNIGKMFDVVLGMASNVSDSSEQIVVKNREDAKECEFHYFVDKVLVTFSLQWVIDNRTTAEMA